MNLGDALMDTQPDSIGERLLSGAKTAAEFSGVAPAARLMGMGQPEGYAKKPPMTDIDTALAEDRAGTGVSLGGGMSQRDMDILSLGMMLAGGSAMKASGAPAGAVLKGMGAGAVGAGAGEAGFGPEARALGQKIENPLLRMAVEAAPSMGGAMMGPAWLQQAKTLGMAGASALTDGYSGTGWRQAGKNTGLPITMNVAEGIRKGEYASADAVRIMEDARKQGLALTPAQAEEFIRRKQGLGRNTMTPNAKYEMRTEHSDSATNFRRLQGERANEIVENIYKKNAPGAELPAEQVGRGFIEKYQGTLGKVSGQWERFFEDIQKSPEALRRNPEYASAIKKAFKDSITSSQADLALSTQQRRALDGMLNQFLSDPKRHNFAGAAWYRRNIQDFTESAFRAQGLDQAPNDFLRRNLYDRVRKAIIDTAKRDKRLEKIDAAGKFDKFLRESEIFDKSDEAQVMKRITGVKSSRSVFETKGGGSVAEASLADNMAPQLKAMVEHGTMDAQDAKKLILSGIKSRATDANGKFIPEKFIKEWRGISKQTKELLGNDVVKSIDEIGDAMDVMGFPQNSGVPRTGMGAAQLGITGTLLDRASNPIKPGYYGIARKYYMPARAVAGMPTPQTKLLDLVTNLGYNVPSAVRDVKKRNPGNGATGGY
jgi:hypothetical protein